MYVSENDSGIEDENRGAHAGWKSHAEKNIIEAFEAIFRADARKPISSALFVSPPPALLNLRGEGSEIHPILTPPLFESSSAIVDLSLSLSLWISFSRVSCSRELKIFLSFFPVYFEYSKLERMGKSRRT